MSDILGEPLRHNIKVSVWQQVYELSRPLVNKEVWANTHSITSMSVWTQSYDGIKDIVESQLYHEL